MSRLELDIEWLEKLIPNGLTYPSSTLISGPGGSGKPLVGLGIIHEWLKSGGNIIFVPLQYPKTKFVKTSLKDLYDLDLDGWKDRVAYVRFDLDEDAWKKEEENKVGANLLKPNVWNGVIENLEEYFDEGKETMVFASALNLLLFSPTYREPSLDAIQDLIKNNGNRSYLFTVSTSAFREDVRKWEDEADNLLFTQMKGDMGIYLRAERLENEEVSNNEIKVPIEKEMLKGIKEVAKSVRERKIPKLKKI